MNYTMRHGFTNIKFINRHVILDGSYDTILEIFHTKSKKTLYGDKLQEVWFINIKRISFFITFNGHNKSICNF